jgi:hypothetical protein
MGQWPRRLSAEQRARRAGPLADWVRRGWKLGRSPGGLTATKCGVTVAARCWRSLRNRMMAAELRFPETPPPAPAPEMKP